MNGAYLTLAEQPPVAFSKVKRVPIKFDESADRTHYSLEMLDLARTSCPEARQIGEANVHHDRYGLVEQYRPQRGQSQIRVPRFEETLEDTCTYADGAMIWNIALEPTDTLLAITKKYLASGSSPMAGSCG